LSPPLSFSSSIHAYLSHPHTHTHTHTHPVPIRIPELACHPIPLTCEHTLCFSHSPIPSFLHVLPPFICPMMNNYLTSPQSCPPDSQPISLPPTPYRTRPAPSRTTSVDSRPRLVLTPPQSTSAAGTRVSTPAPISQTQSLAVQELQRVLASPRSVASFTSGFGSGYSSGNQFPFTPNQSQPTSPELAPVLTPDREYPHPRVDYDPEYQFIRLQARKTSYFDMAAPTNMKRKVVILGSPSVGECSIPLGTWRGNHAQRTSGHVVLECI